MTKNQRAEPVGGRVLVVEIMIPIQLLRPGDRVEVAGRSGEVTGTHDIGVILGIPTLTISTTAGPLSGPIDALVCVGITSARLI